VIFEHGLEGFDGVDFVVVLVVCVWDDYLLVVFDVFCAVYANGVTVFFVCSGAFVLGVVGLLDGDFVFVVDLWC